MKVRKDILELAKKLGVDIEISPDKDGWTVEALAPDGMEWEESGGVSLVAPIFTLWPESKKEAFDDLAERMSKGLVEETD